MMETIDPHKSIDFIYKNSTAYAKAKAEVTYLEEFRKSKKAILFSIVLNYLQHQDL